MANILATLLLFTMPEPDGQPLPPPPPLEEMCLSVTSYWVWDKNGKIFDGYHGQCDADCSFTGAGYYLPEKAEDYQGGYAACIYDWTMLKGHNTRTVNVLGEKWHCVDNFGKESYWEPFFHYGYWDWVIPVDLLAPLEHGLYCDWDVGWGKPQIMEDRPVATSN